MLFKRTTRFNPEKLPSKNRKVWLSEKPMRYRITWRDKVFGVSVDKGYQVLVESRKGNGETFWDFADNKRLVRTFKRAQEIAKRHKQIWDRATLTPGIRALIKLFGGHLPYYIPSWITLDPMIEKRILNPEPIKYKDDDDDSEVETIPELPPEGKHEIDRGEEPELQAPVKKRGRPKGSRNKPKEETREKSVKKRGRPKGSRNKPKT